MTSSRSAVIFMADRAISMSWVYGGLKEIRPQKTPKPRKMLQDRQNRENTNISQGKYRNIWKVKV